MQNMMIQFVMTPLHIGQLNLNNGMYMVSTFIMDYDVVYELTANCIFLTCYWRYRSFVHDNYLY